MNDLPLLRDVPPEPMRPLATRLRDAARLYPWLHRLLMDAAAAIDGRPTEDTRPQRRRR